MKKSGQEEEEEEKISRVLKLRTHEGCQSHIADTSQTSFMRHFRGPTLQSVQLLIFKTNILSHSVSQSIYPSIHPLPPRHSVA